MYTNNKSKNHITKFDLLDLKEDKKFGWAGFITGAVNFVKNTRDVQRGLKSHHMNFRLVLEATDWPTIPMLYFTEHTIDILAIDKETADDPSKWDGKMIAPARIFLDYFMGNIGVVRCLLPLPILGKIKARKLMNLTKLIWYVKCIQKVFGSNKFLAKAMFYKNLKATKKKIQ